MFLDFIDSKEYSKLFKHYKEETTYPAYYNYWRNELFESCMRLFVWKNTGRVKPKEIEQRLIIQGRCAITKILNENELTAMYGSFYGVTKYQDEYPNYTVTCPVYSGSRSINKDVIIIDNNELRNPTYALIHHYSTLLAHTEVTIIQTLISARDSGGIPTARTNKQKSSIESYQSKLYNGKYGVIADIGALGVEYVGGDRRTSQNIIDLYVTKERLLKDFYTKIGLRTGFEKRSNAISEEVISDKSMLSFNITDMYECRKKGCDMVNALYGTNWNVELSDDLKESIIDNPLEIRGGDNNVI